MAIQAKPEPEGSHRSTADFHGYLDHPVVRDVEDNWGAQCPVFRSDREGIMK